MPNMETGLSPDELFSITTSDHRELLNLHPWGCPVHVLMPTLQDGKKLPKWQPRARRGQFMGMVTNACIFSCFGAKFDDGELVSSVSCGV